MPSHTTTSRRTHRTHRSPTASVPPTVWTCADTPSDPTRQWPLEVVDQVLDAFAGDQVAVLDPTADEGTPAGQVALVLERIRAHDRATRRIPHRPQHTPGAAAPQPYWAGMLAEHIDAALTPPPPAPGGDDPSDAVAWADLMLASVSPHEPVTDSIGLTPAAVLRPGGTLVVLTHSMRHDGGLLDPTGAIVAACQNADLLYLQHLIALHTPIREGGLTPISTPTTAVDGRHQQVHSDLLVFTQAHSDVTEDPTT